MNKEKQIPIFENNWSHFLDTFANLGFYEVKKEYQ